ncbi:hypothetical protein COLO4_28329 [Corchorus olitorius]|uniref:Uncharacterized protein n=1 Tax=Corchorus olitorius TaxID=93759 RepID=A0A1R3HLR7_9ROSI|nr:hypothetical protein COLO4_28329 [Corchorus olitorius]
MTLQEVFSLPGLAGLAGLEILAFLSNRFALTNRSKKLDAQNSSRFLFLSGLEFESCSKGD